MPYHIIWEEEGVTIKFTRSASAKEVMAIDDLIYAHPLFDRMKYQIFDFTGIDAFNFTSEEMIVIGSLDKSASRWNTQMKVAIISTSESFLKSLEYYEKKITGSPWITRVFDNMEEARRWVSV